jgi:hypothetical protein
MSEARFLIQPIDYALLVWLLSPPHRLSTLPTTNGATIPNRA